MFQSDADVSAALESAVAADAATDAEQAAAFDMAGTPAGEMPTPVQPEPVAQPTPAEPAPVDTTPSLWDGEPINPDTLPDELKPLAKQLEAAFTRKTQDVAEMRKQLEALGDVESLQEAVDLYSRIQDPQVWPQLHAELSAAMQQAGLTPAEAAAEATAALEEAAGETPTLPEDLDDPELAPLVASMKAMQAKLAQFEQQQAASREAEEAERMYHELQAQVTQQKNAILEANPTYKQDDMSAIIERSSWFDGNLLQAQAAYEADRQRIITEYLATKSAAAHETAHQTPPASAAGLSSQRVTQAETIRDVEEEAVEYMRAQQRAGELEL